MFVEFKEIDLDVKEECVMFFEVWKLFEDILSSEFSKFVDVKARFFKCVKCKCVVEDDDGCEIV